MTDELDIPEFLRRTETPEEADARRKRMRRPSGRRLLRADLRKRNYDREGRLLPEHMDDESWALLRAIEKDEAAKAKAAKVARLAALTEANAEKRRIRALAKATLR